MLIQNINKQRKSFGLSFIKIEPILPDLSLIPITFTQKQEEIYKMSKDLNKWCLVGGVGSGKTTLNCILFLERVKRCTDKDAMFGIAGITHGAVIDVIISAIEERLGLIKGFITINSLTNSFKLFGKTIKILSCGDANDFTKWQGINLSGVWGTEVIGWNEENFIELTGRVRNNEAFQLFDTNPSTPMHWFKSRILDNKNSNIKEIKLNTIHNKDNLVEGFIETQIANRGEDEAKRMIDGEWCISGKAPLKNINYYENNCQVPEYWSNEKRPVMFIDPAYSDYKYADGTGISIVWSPEDNDKLVSYGCILKNGVFNNLKEICELINKYKVYRVWIEQGTLNRLDHWLDDEYKRLYPNSKKTIEILSIGTPTENKEARIASLIPLIAQNKITIHPLSSKSYYHEIVNFRFGDDGKKSNKQHDDAPDSLNGAIKAFSLNSLMRKQAVERFNNNEV